MTCDGREPVPTWPHAERCGEFIQEILDHLNVNVLIYNEEPIKDLVDLKKFPAHCGGLYLFYLKGADSDAWRPVYLGVTKRSFRERFRGHAQNGVISWFQKGCGIPAGYNLYAVCTHYQGASASYLKKLLHGAFDFPLKQRRSLDFGEPYPYEWMLNNWAHPWCWEDLERERQVDRRLHGEKCGEMVTHIFDELNCNYFLYDKEPILDAGDISKFPANQSGFYVLYLKASPDSKERYPITVGLTKTSFKARFEQQAAEGVMSKWWAMGRSDMQVYAMCSHHSGAAGTAMKRFFLNNMSFPLREYGSQKRPFDLSTPLPLKAIGVPYKRLIGTLKKMK